MINKINTFIENLPLDIAPKGLYEPIRYVLSLGGKRIRPVLMMMTYEMYGHNSDDILPQAVALETYHNFTLLHDDVMDNANMRRGMPTVHKKWNVNTAILSGDNMLVLAFKLMQTQSTRHGENTEFLNNIILSTFTQTAIEINEGQQYDVDFENRYDVTEEEYIKMIRLKTSVLLACALKIGAILAGAPQSDIDTLYDFGINIGLAFQLQDDYLDCYGDPKVFGKAIGGDICSNKKTYMLINALNKAKGNDKDSLLSLIGARYFDPQDKISSVIALYNKLGIGQMAMAKMEEYYQKALLAMSRVNVSYEKKQSILAYAAKMMKRNK